ncbi:hypothetical protein K488DRAFT_54431 [Vararia minispora EC-137]|uniref:Uncharacterized protein n=1 Tax=Vararia minispora EC-137 TaxID=1314806 RepID=A0ACB8QFB9_9AGAM|nr:hypothetical protein K488DRAFT_54431 [Vararia minispora EC-137]
MPPSGAKCKICRDSPSKYSCPRCHILYCSIPCYKTHNGGVIALTTSYMASLEQVVFLASPLRPLTELNWPYVADESAYPDPLKRDDPKPLQLRQYEAIATSPRIREILAAHPQLKDILRTIESLRGAAREEALQRGLGVAVGDSTSRTPQSRTEDNGFAFMDESDQDTLRKLAEAVEAAVRGDQTLGLDWGD